MSVSSVRGRSRVDPIIWTSMDLMQNSCILIRAHLGQFSEQKMFRVINSVQISSAQLLLCKRYSRLKLSHLGIYISPIDCKMITSTLNISH